MSTSNIHIEKFAFGAVSFVGVDSRQKFNKKLGPELIQIVRTAINKVEPWRDGVCLESRTGISAPYGHCHELGWTLEVRFSPYGRQFALSRLHAFTEYVQNIRKEVIRNVSTELMREFSEINGHVYYEVHLL